jgi:hypothetical protein
MNWIYTWYNPRIDGDAQALSRGMGDIFLKGIQAQHVVNQTKKSLKKKSTN